MLSCHAHGPCMAKIPARSAQAWKPDLLLSENIVPCNAILASESFLNVSIVNFWLRAMSGPD